MFPISSTALTAPQIPVVTPTSETTAVNNSTVARVGSALDAPAPASVTIDLSPVASFLLTVSQSQQQLTQLQSAIANGADPQEAARRAATLNEATQNVVNAFNLLPAVDFNQPQQQSASLLNNLVQSLTQQTATNTATQQQNLAQIGLTLQPPLLSDATGGLSLDNEVLRAAFNSNGERTTSTLQNTLDTFSNLATQFAEQLSAAGSASLPTLGLAQQLALTPADVAANARLDLARAEIDNLVQLPLPTSGADRLAAQRAALEQPATNLNPATPSPIVNPLQASTAEVIAAQNAEAAQAANEQSAQTNATAQATQTAQAGQTAQAAQNAQAAQTNDATQAAANDAQDTAATQSNVTTAADAARATASAQAAREASASGLNAATAAGTQAASQAALAQNAAATAAANQANANQTQTVAASVSAANAASNAAAAQAQAAQNAVAALSAQNASAIAAVAQARAAQASATTPEAINAAAAVVAQQASAAQATANNLAAANAAAAAATQQAAAAANAAQQAGAQQQTLLAQQSAAQQSAALQNAAAQTATAQEAGTQQAALQNTAEQNAAEQASAAQLAAAQAAARAPTDPLRANPALAAAIAAYNISDPAILGANARAGQASVGGIPRVAAVGAAARARGIGNAP